MNPDDPFERVRKILGKQVEVKSTDRWLTWSGDGASNNKLGRETKMAKNLYVVTMPATVTVLVEADGEKDAKASATKTAEEVLGKSLGILRVVGDVKATAVATTKTGKKSAPDDDEDEKEEEADEEEEEEEEEESDEDDEEEEEDDEEEKVSTKKKDKGDVKKSDKKADKSDGKKIKIKLRG